MSLNDCIGKTLKPWPILVDHYSWGIKVSHEGGELFFDTGYVYEGEGAAHRAFCKLLDNLPQKDS